MREGKSIGCSMGKIVVTKKIAATHKYVVYLCMEIYINFYRQNSFNHLLTSFCHFYTISRTFTHLCFPHKNLMAECARHVRIYDIINDHALAHKWSIRENCELLIKLQRDLN